MRIAFISHFSGRGGAEKALLEIIRSAKRCGHVPFCFAPREGWLTNELEARGIGTIVIPYPWWASDSMPLPLRGIQLLRTPLAARKLARNLTAGRFDLVCSNSAVICVGAIAARWTGLPHIWHMHEYMPVGAGHSFHLGREFCTRVIREYSSLVVGASRQVLQALGVEGTVLYLPPRTASVTKQPHPIPTLVCVGHMTGYRRHTDAIAALQILRERGRNVCLRIVGDGERRAGLEVQARGLPVTFVGSVPDASQEIANATALVNCNSAEAFGRVTVEAMALRTPVIASRAGANPELIRHGESGLLFGLGNPSDIADQVCRLLDEPGLSERLVTQGLAFVRSIDDLDTNLERILASVSTRIKVARRPVLGEA